MSKPTLAKVKVTYSHRIDGNTPPTTSDRVVYVECHSNGFAGPDRYRSGDISGICSLAEAEVQEDIPGAYNLRSEYLGNG